MRTTVDIDPDVLKKARALARERGESLGRTISELIRESLEPRGFVIAPDGLPILRPLPGAKPVTDEIVKELLESGY